MIPYCIVYMIYYIFTPSDYETWLVGISPQLKQNHRWLMTLKGKQTDDII